jgi:hypothetical protein
MAKTELIDLPDEFANRDRAIALDIMSAMQQTINAL